MTNRLLLVEPSATMRYVLEKHAESLGFTVDVTDSYTQAAESLDRQYQKFGAEYSGLLFGWPTIPVEDATQLANLLEQSAYKDLPVVVMSTDMRAETRAWVSARDNTAVLPWKEYQGLEALLQRLVDVGSSADEGDAFSAKFDNSDIHLLVVDDSATIRYSLRDLFQMQGYTVSLAATGEDALRLAGQSRVDIAIVDFYLSETTGDLVCRELSTHADVIGDIVCTVLTGTYSDHIIKRSLRAGAVECMFKNESSELLLSRVDAISRFVRQQRHIQGERFLLEEIIDSLAGAVLVIEADHRISYVSQAGGAALQLADRHVLIGQPSETLLEVDGPNREAGQLHSATWRRPDGTPINIDYEYIHLAHSNCSLIRFAPAHMPVEQSRDGIETPVEAPLTRQDVVHALDLEEDSVDFVEQMHDYLLNGPEENTKISLLVVDLFHRDAEDKLHPVDENPRMLEQVTANVLDIYKRESHVARLRGNRYGFLIRHRQDPKAYILVRKIMQLCIEMKINADADTATAHRSDKHDMVCNGSMLSLVDNRSHATSVLLQHAFKGVELVNSRGNDQVLLMDLRRMLSAYPAEPVRPS